MKSNNKALGILGLILFFAAALIGILLFASLTWANLEANFYFGFNGGADTKMRLVCPHIVTAADSTSVVAYIPNKVERTITPDIESQISGPEITYDRFRTSIDPGVTKALSWKVGPSDVVYGHLILAYGYQYASFKTGTATNTCGSLWLNLPFITGTQLYYLAILVSFIGMIGGILLWYFNTRRPGVNLRERASGMIVLIFIIIIGLVIASIGPWIFGVLTFAISVVLYIILISRRISGSF